jgi:hypothetical protein
MIALLPAFLTLRCYSLWRWPLLHAICSPAVLSIVILFLLAAVIPSTAGAAELTVSAEVSESYEDNVIGLTADNPNVGVGNRGGGGLTMGGMNLKGGMGTIPGGGGATGGVRRTGDFSTGLYADIGWDHDMTDATGLLILASVEHKAYKTYSEFDFTIGTFSAGVTHQFLESVTGRIAASVSGKDFDGTLRDSTSYGVMASLRERLSAKLWLKETLDFEQNKSRSSIYDYTGASAGIKAGYDLSEQQTLSAGYSYLIRDFKDSAPAFKLTSQVASLHWTLDLKDYWSILAGYDHEWADSTIPNTATTNNIYTIGFRYEY